MLLDHTLVSFMIRAIALRKAKMQWMGVKMQWMGAKNKQQAMKRSWVMLLTTQW
ncbi:hypothetical protein PISMIDRAFT_17030 [Pisolithus microcarpus 441]|uniref:Uncharacterized protein n=1 Tax=Pisolithus microcarpus 441 TaxID=765257 RepID=A0A0C9YX68_9AGAM|nr:hypothetical protein PISMIDRAFT_17030 [Pisolithus microcarpus 441]